MVGYHQHEKGGEFVTYARLRIVGTNGFQEPAVGLETTDPFAAGTSTGTKTREVLKGRAIEGARGKEPVQAMGAAATRAASPAASGTERILGTKRLYADGKFNSKDGKAKFMETQWRGLHRARQRRRDEEIPVPDQ
jgi:arsenite oxidase large subunit